MDTLSFIGHCIGAAPATCEFIDRIEDDFKMYEWGFDLEETLLIVLIQQSIRDHKHCITGNMLIQYYYNEIIKHYLDAYDELSKDLFRTWVNGNDSALCFNSQAVYNKKDLEERIQEWINNQ